MEYDGVAIPNESSRTSFQRGNDFGSVAYPDGSLVRNFLVRNGGDQALALELQSSNASNFSVSGVGAGVPAGGADILTVDFHPTRVGMETARIDLFGENGEKVFTFNVKGIGVSESQDFIVTDTLHRRGEDLHKIIDDVVGLEMKAEIAEWSDILEYLDNDPSRLEAFYDEIALENGEILWIRPTIVGFPPYNDSLLYHFVRVDSLEQLSSQYVGRDRGSFGTLLRYDADLWGEDFPGTSARILGVIDRSWYPILELDPGETITHGSGSVSSQSLFVDSNVSWNAVDDMDWLTLLIDSGVGDTEIRYSLSRNASSSDRSGVITVSGRGITKTLTVTQRRAASSGSDPWFSGAVHLDGGWRYYDWFKAFKPTGESWFYHGRHGWLYSVGDSTEGIFFWDVAMRRWYWTNESVYPWIYLFGPNEDWYFFHETGSPGSRYFNRGGRGAILMEGQLQL